MAVVNSKHSKRASLCSFMLSPHMVQPISISVRILDFFLLMKTRKN